MNGDIKKLMHAMVRMGTQRKRRSTTGDCRHGKAAECAPVRLAQGSWPRREMNGEAREEGEHGEGREGLKVGSHLAAQLQKPQ
jgi:hypothetical protein